MTYGDVYTARIIYLYFAARPAEQTVYKPKLTLKKQYSDSDPVKWYVVVLGAIFPHRKLVLTRDEVFIRRHIWRVSFWPDNSQLLGPVTRDLVDGRKEDKRPCDDWSRSKGVLPSEHPRFALERIWIKDLLRGGRHGTALVQIGFGVDFIDL